MKQEGIEELCKEFPFLERSLLADILMACGGDVASARYVILSNFLNDDDNDDEEEDESEASDTDTNIEGNTSICLTGISKSGCGYCKKKNSSEEYYAYLLEVTPSDLQFFCDTNWRRSGTLLYKRINQTTCCPYYTVRLPVAKFAQDKHQRIVMRNMDRYLETGTTKAPPAQEAHAKQPEAAPALSAEESAAVSHAKALTEAAVSELYGEELRAAGSDPSAVAFNFTHNPQSAWSTRGKVSCNAAIVLAGVLRKLTKGKTQVSPKDAAARISDVIEKRKESVLETPSVANNAGFINFLITHNTTTASEQPSTEKAKPTNEEKRKKKATEASTEHMPAHKIEHVFKKSEFDAEEFKIYKKYQAVVHKETDSTEKGYTRFLVNTPLKYTPIGAVLPLGVSEYGTYHLQYRIDGKLVGVSVLDFLPQSLSSVYFFYDTDYEFLQLGKYSALWEIRYISEIIAKRLCGIEYYYLGFYIHTCGKMKYKLQYKPSELLCEKTRSWVPADACVPILDAALTAAGTCGFQDLDPGAQPRKVPTEEEIEAFVDEMIRTGVKCLSKKARIPVIRKMLHDFVVYTSIEFAKSVLMSVYDEDE